MKWFGSVYNRLEEACASPEPVVGMGVTEFLWSDRSPYEIIEVIDSRHIIIRRLDYKRIDGNGMSECQDYEYFSNEKYPGVKLFKTKDGHWRERIGRNGLGCNTFKLGEAERYYDFSF